ncbi:MAG: M56 family metallopeptidase [Dyadobacter sp.]|uniref:M56 family metallopeptidase n=1 Tax=Dyadobacter sp. TaxID=1914288 RepID=UPI001AFEDB8A|nr:M56 family metallopeptidase [Dyadobacter sp.]MBO9613876.1 M56 family metallopeptidase [Dyadobacter sp.]
MLIPYLMKVSLVLAVLTLAYRWLIQFETFSRLNRVLLWLNVAAAWTLPLVSLPSWGPVEVQTEFHQSIPKVVEKLPALGPSLAGIQSEPFKTQIAAAEPSMTVADWLLVMYFAGMMIFSARLLFQLSRLFIIVAKGHAEQYAGGNRILRVAGSAPYSFFKWIILDPSKHSDFELRNIIAHETEHSRQWHSADLLLTEIQKICLWFNPFAWIHQKLVRENLEYLADRAVLDNGIEKKQYQYNLLHTVMRTQDLPLTNSFAQSLLKKRIKMMNRKPSHYLVWGKYVAVLALVYISSAFVAPYREQIVELAPEMIKPFVKPLVGEVITRTEPAKDTLTSTIKNEETNPVPLHAKLVGEVYDTLRIAQDLGPKVKGIFVRNDTLYWAITPLMTWEQINDMKPELKKFGYDMTINKLQYDPLQNFITSISVHVKGQGSMGEGDEGDDSTTPMKGYSGFVRKGGLGMGQSPPAPLRSEMERDYRSALAIKKEKEVEFFEKNLFGTIGPNSGGSINEGFFDGNGNKGLLEREGFGKSEQNTLLFTDKHANSEFYINTNRSTREEASKLTVDKIKKISFRENNQHKTYFVIYTK